MRALSLTLLPIILLSSTLLRPLSAQDDVLAVERRADQRRHAVAVARLHTTRVTLRTEELTPRELCRYLSTATGGELSFQCRERDSAAVGSLALDLRSASLWSLMSIAQIETGLRFVYRFGVVFLVPADEVKPLTTLEIYDLRGMCMRLRSFPGPELGLGIDRSERPLFPEPVETDQTVSGFTADGVETLLRESVRPESWEDDRVRLINQDGLFLIRQTPQAHDEIARLLARLGLISAPRVVLRR